MELLMENKWKLPPPPSSKKKASRSCRRGSLSIQRPAAGSQASTPTSFSTRVASLVKEQRARFYIMRRCVTMLICWHDY